MTVEVVASGGGGGGTRSWWWHQEVVASGGGGGIRRRWWWHQEVVVASGGGGATRRRSLSCPLGLNPITKIRQGQKSTGLFSKELTQRARHREHPNSINY